MGTTHGEHRNKERLRFMKACGVEGTNQGLVAFTSQSIHYICRFTLKEQMMKFVIALSRTV